MFTVNRIFRGSQVFKHSQRYVSSYSLPHVPLLEEINVNKEEFKGLFPHSTYNQLWFQRGEKILEELNECLIESQVDGPNNLKELINLTINKPDLVKIYNNSSILYNLQFFFESLKEGEPYAFEPLTEKEMFRNPDIEGVQTNVPHDEDLVNWLNASFGSVTEFKTLLLNSAKAIKGDGITWLVAEPTVGESSLKNTYSSGLSDISEPKYSKLSIMNTYNAGTVDDAIRSGQILKLQQQKLAKEALENEGKSETTESSALKPTNENYLVNMEEAELLSLYSDKRLVPVLAIDASMRNYLSDYGVFGKQQYLENVWNCVNWDIVKQRLPPRLIANFSI